MPPFTCILYYFYLLAFVSTIATTGTRKGHNLIVILIDGLSNNLLEKHINKLNAFLELTKSGSKVDHLKPVYPTQSFPNWMSIFTGLYVENHGLVADYMWDAESNRVFNRGENMNDTTSFWWRNRPQPIWYTAGKSQISVHCYWIPWCDQPYEDLIVKVSVDRKVNLSDPQQTDSFPQHISSIIEWIQKYQAYRQQFFLIRFGSVEKALVEFGSTSKELTMTLEKIDSYLLELQNKINELNLFETTNLMVISNHGMQPVNTERVVFIDECFEDASKIDLVVNSYAMMMVFTSHVNDIFYELRLCELFSRKSEYYDYYDDKNTQAAATVHKTVELPEELHWKNSRFMPSIIIIAQDGTALLTNKIPSVPNNHRLKIEVKEVGGYLNNVSSMHGIFLARGPSFKVNHKSKPINMVDLYQLMLNTLSIESPHSHNGTWSNVEELLMDWEARIVSNRATKANQISLLCLLFLVFSFAFLCIF